MSEVTKPIALDESLNTTESTPRNIADVLASGLANIANNVKPDGSDISISVPGMSANNVNDGFSELNSTLDAKNSIVFSGSLADVAVTSGSFVELKKVTAPTTGYYLVSAYHEWANGSGSVVYADAINGYTQRNLSKGNGGGAFVTFVCKYNANDEIVYKTYLYSGDDTTRRGYFSVVKL